MRPAVFALVVGCLVVFSASATAVLPAHATAAPAPSAQVAPTDRPLTSGESYWQGWLLSFDGSEIVDDPASAPAADRTFQIRAVTDGEVGSLVREFTIDANGSHRIDTGTISGEFVVQYQGDTVYVEDGTGYLAPPAGADASVNTSAWTVTHQTLAVDWVDQTLYTGQFSEFNVSSNRDEPFTVAVSGDGLTFNQLTRLFASDDFATNFGAESDADKLLLRVRPGQDLTVSPLGFDPGTYTLRFEATDTSARVTTTFEVQAADRFVHLERGEDAGDVVDASIKCSHCYLIVGGKDQGIVDIVELSDGNGDGYVNLSINTRYAGLYQGASGVPSGVTYYPSDHDQTSRYSPGRRLESIDHVDPHYLNELRSTLGLEPNGRSAPITPGRLDLTVAGSDYAMSRSEYGQHRAPLGGEPVVRDEQDVSSVILHEPTLKRLRPYGVPVQYGSPGTLTELTTSLEARQTVAMGDRIVLRADITGVFGYLAHAGTDLDRVLDNSDEGIDMTLTTADGGRTIDLDRSWTRLVTDPGSDNLYVVIDTGTRGARRVLEVGTTYRARLTLTGVKSYQQRYDIYDAPAGFSGYPYLPPGRTRQVETTFEIVPPSATVEPATAAPIDLPRTQRATVSGRTTVAPQSVLTVAVAGTGPATWTKSTTITVAPDRTWEATFDLSNTKLGDGFTVTVTKNDRAIGQADGRVVEASTGTGPSGTADTPAGDGATPGPGPDTTVTSTAADGQASGTATADAAGPGGDNSRAGLVPGLSGLLLPAAAGFLLLVVIGFFVMRLR